MMLAKIRKAVFSLAAVKVIILLAVLAGLYLVAERYGFDDFVKNLRETRQASGYLLSVFVYVGLFVFVSIAPVSIRDPLKVLGVIVFGPLASALYLWLADVIAAVLSFFMAKWFGREFVEKITGRRMAWINHKLEESGLKNMVVLRVLPTPYRHLNLLSGVTRISFRDFLLGTTIGALIRNLYGQFLLWPFAGLLLSDEAKASWLFWISIGGLAVMMAAVYATFRIIQRYWPDYFGEDGVIGGPAGEAGGKG